MNYLGCGRRGNINLTSYHGVGIGSAMGLWKSFTKKARVNVDAGAPQIRRGSGSMLISLRETPICSRPEDHDGTAITIPR